jgi:DNA-binding NarL/FixJ family response regulator
MIRVVVADDHAIVRSGLRALCLAAGDIEVVAEADNGRAALRLVEDPALAIDVLVLDLSLPRLNGMEVLERAMRARPSLQVLILSMHPEAQYATRMLRSGAAAYLSKDRSDAELVATIRRLAGGAALPKAAPSPAPPQLHDALTAREMQVFLLLITGQGVSDIAAELDLTVSTVSTHLGKVKAKLGLETVPQIVRYALRVGLVD